MHPRVRPAREGDVDDIVRLVQALADYERCGDQVHATPERFRDALFGAAPAVHALVAEGPEGTVVGVAVYFLSFSTWEGVHGLYLDDLFVEADHRGSGLGKALLSALAEIAVERGYARFEWVVLDWNEPAIAFYRRVGAVPVSDWTTFRLTGGDLRALATTASPSSAPAETSNPSAPGDAVPGSR